MSGGVSTRLHAQYLPQGKEKLFLRDILSLKRRRYKPPPALYSDWIARSKYYGGITKQMNYNKTILQIVKPRFKINLFHS